MRTIAVAPGLSPGVAWVEVQRGALIGRPRPLLVLPDEEFAEDVEIMIDCLLRKGSSPAQVDDFVVDLGRVLAAEHDQDGQIGPIQRDLTCKVRIPCHEHDMDRHSSLCGCMLAEGGRERHARV